MGVHIYDKKLPITAEPKTIRFSLTKKIDDSLKHETDSIVKCNYFLAKQKIKKEIDKLLFKYKHENDIHQQGKQ